MNNTHDQGSFPLTLPLLRLGEVLFTLGDATVHVLVVGSSGSGKTSAALRLYLRAYLRHGMGGLVICTKADDRDMLLRWLEETGRMDDVCVFAVGQMRFDILQYLIRHPNPAVRNITNIIETLEKMMMPLLWNAQGGSSDEEFWKIQRRILLTHLLVLARHSGEPVTFDLLASILKTAPQDPEMADTPEVWSNTAFGRCLRQATTRTAGQREAKEVQKAAAYFLTEYPFFPDKTRGCVVMTVLGLFSCFQDPMVEDLTSALDFTPEEALEGRVLIVDLPDNLVGRMLALGVKHLFQKAAMRRSTGPDDATMIPAFFCVDEFQQWITPDDAGFLAKARSSRICCLCLTQNIPGVIAAVGGPTPRESVDALCGNFSTKTFLNNTDPTTTDWMSQMIGKAMKFNVSTQNQTRTTFWGKPQFHISQQRELEINPEDFMLLRCGGPRNDYEVDAIVLLGAKAVPVLGRPWCKVVFRQRDNGLQSSLETSREGAWNWMKEKLGMRRVPDWSSRLAVGRWLRGVKRWRW